jgi:hypothetical protein
MPFTRWLRTNSEHYLLRAAQEKISRAYDANRPRSPHGARAWFWQRIYTPVYRVLPWSLRRRVLRMLPGSHRRMWHTPPRPAGPAI